MFVCPIKLRLIILMAFSLICSTLPWGLLYINLYGLFSRKDVPAWGKKMAERLSDLTKGAVPAATAIILDAGQVWFFPALATVLAANTASMGKKIRNHENIYVILGFLFPLFPAELSVLIVVTLTLCLTLGYVPLASVIIFSPLYFVLIYINEFPHPLAIAGYAMLLLWSLAYSTKRSKKQFMIARASLRSSRSRRKIYRYLGLVFPLILFPLAGRSALIRVLWSVASILWGLELTRFLSPAIQKFVLTLMKPISEKYEQDKISGTTLYFTGCALASLFPGLAGPVALVMATLGDAWAMLVGSEWGKTGLYRGKSMEGSLACFVVCISAGWLYLYFYGNGQPLFLTTITGALIATLTELFSGKMDNLIMPPATAFALFLML